jgi:GNAT superfamily N-acetyltransferase
MQEEAGKENVDWFKVSHTMVECIRGGLLLVYSTEEGLIIGSIGGSISSEWHSTEALLGDYWFFVHPEHRSSPAAFKLMKSWKALGEDIGLTIKAGHTLGSDIERKDNMYEKLGFTKTGALFERIPHGRAVRQ